MTRLPKRITAAEIESAEEIDLDTEAVYVNGRRITEADASAWADDAERAHAERVKHLIPGGKSLSGEHKRSPVVQIVLPETLKR
jgi:hypothetical protein